MTTQEIEKIFKEHSQEEIFNKYSKKELREMFSLYAHVRPNPALNKERIATELENAIHFKNEVRRLLDEIVDILEQEEMAIDLLKEGVPVEKVVTYVKFLTIQDIEELKNKLDSVQSKPTNSF